MTAVPAIYGEVSEAAKAAYARWTDALVEKAGHLLDCTDGCDVFTVGCPDGARTADAEQAARRDWHAAYRGSEVTA